MTSSAEYQDKRWIRTDLAGGGAVRRRPRRLDRQRRPADDRQSARLLPGEPRLGGQRLRPHLRRLPAPRRSHGRPARSATRVHGRTAPRRGRLARRGLLRDRGTADRGPCRPGTGGGDHLPRRALDRHHDLQRRRRAKQSARGLGRRRGRRGRGRSAARWDPHRRPRLGMGAVGERSRQPHRLRPLAAAADGKPRHRRGARLRRRRRGLDHRRPLASRLRGRRRRERRLGLDQDARL